MSEAGPAPSESDPRDSVAKRVFVVGAGIMGSGIAAQAALAGYPVTLEDVNEELARRGLANAARAMDHAVQRGKLGAGAREEARSIASTSGRWLRCTWWTMESYRSTKTST